MITATILVPHINPFRDSLPSSQYAALAKELNVPVYKLRGDEEREFVQSNFNTQSFPTINVVNGNGDVVKYESEKRDVASMKAFVESKL